MNDYRQSLSKIRKRYQLKRMHEKAKYLDIIKIKHLILNQLLKKKHHIAGDFRER